MRDPRTDPQPGDVVRKLLNVANKLYETRTVEGPLLPNGLQWRSDTYHGVCMFSTWKRWAKHAEVVHVAARIPAILQEMIERMRELETGE